MAPATPLLPAALSMAFGRSLAYWESRALDLLRGYTDNR
jgi:hypothetical protein